VAFVEHLGARVAAGSALAVVLTTGMALSGKLGRDSRARMEQLEDHAVAASQVHARVEQRRVERKYDPAAFAANVAADAESLGVSTTLLELGEAQAHFQEAPDAVVLAPGQSWSSRHIAAKVGVEKVQFQQHGAMVSAKHSILVLRNVSRRPIAYYAVVRSHDQGKCESRGVRMHNAMALMPDEQAEIVVCPGGGKVRIDDLQVLEITELGYMYFSQVPPVAVGYEQTVAAAHTPIRRVTACRDLDSATVVQRIGDGLTRWVDVADFFSRHNCHRFELPASYRHTGLRLKSLPIQP
jgi:hypothetical protein